MSYVIEKEKPKEFLNISNNIGLPAEFAYNYQAKGISLRTTTPTDLGLIVKIEHETHNIGHSSRDDHLNLIDNPDWMHFVIQNQGQVVGYYIAGLEKGEYGDGIITVNSLRHVIFPSHRNQGLGTASNRLRLHMLLDVMKVDAVWLDVFSDNNDAIRLYRRLGWQEEDGGLVPATALGAPLLDSSGQQRYLRKFWFTQGRYLETKNNPDMDYFRNDSQIKWSIKITRPSWQ